MSRTRTNVGEITKFENSLAYYYAEQADPRNEAAARLYAVSARKNSPNRAETLDTEGYVKITYGKTKEEVLEGLSLCGQAKELGVPILGYEKAVKRAADRLSKLEPHG